MASIESSTPVSESSPTESNPSTPRKFNGIIDYLSPTRLHLAIGISIALLFMGGFAGWAECRLIIISNWRWDQAFLTFHLLWLMTTCLAMFAVGMNVGWGQPYRLGCWFIGLSVVGSVLLNALLFWQADSVLITRETVSSIVERHHWQIVPWERLNQWLLTLPSVSVVAPLAIVLLPMLIAWAPLAIYRAISRRLIEKRGHGITTKNFLIAVVIFLMGLAIIRNLTYDPLTQGMEFFQAFLVGIFVLGFYTIFFFLPTWSINFGTRFRSRWLIPAILIWIPLTCLLVALCSTRALASSLRAPQSLIFYFILSNLIIFGTCALTFYATCVRQPTSIHFKRSSWKQWVSPAWLLLALPFLFLGWAINTYDLDVFLQSPNNLRLDAASAALRVKRDPQITLAVPRENQTNGLVFENYRQRFEFQFDETTQPNALLDFSIYSPPNPECQFRGLRPTIDLSYLPLGWSQITVLESELSMKQLKDIFNCHEVLIGQNVTVVPNDNTKSNTRISPGKTFYAISIHANNCAPILRLLTPTIGPKNRVIITSKIGQPIESNTVPKSLPNLTPEDWNEILRIAAVHPVYLDLPDSYYEKHWQEQVGHPGFENLTIITSNWKAPSIRQAILETRSKVLLGNETWDWDLAYIKPGRVMDSRVHTAIQPKDFDTVYKTNSDGQPTHVYSPFSLTPLQDDSRVDGTAVESLSLDPSWLISSNTRFYLDKEYIEWIESLPNLKHLYLPLNESYIGEFQKLLSITKLSISNGPRTVTMEINDLPKLEHLVLHGQLDLDLQKSLLRSTNLKSLHYVYNESFEYQPTQSGTNGNQKAVLARITKLFPSLKTIKATPSAKFKPELPPEFQEHIREKAKQILETMEK